MFLTILFVSEEWKHVLCTYSISKNSTLISFWWLGALQQKNGVVWERWDLKGILEGTNALLNKNANKIEAEDYEISNTRHLVADDMVEADDKSKPGTFYIAFQSTCISESFFFKKRKG